MSALTALDRLPLVDRFGTDTRSGRVIGTTTRTGHRRHGTDVERVMSIDHGALRVKPLIRPGWGRTAIGYGPFVMRDGLAASVVLLNGRNGSENCDRWPSPGNWLKQWIRGTQSDPPAVRPLYAIGFPRRDSLMRRLRAAYDDARRAPHDRSDLNLALSWLPSPEPSDPIVGPTMAVRSTGPDNADLCVYRDGSLDQVLQLFEVPIRLVMLCTEGTIAFLASADDGAGHWPDVRLLATTEAPVGQQCWLTLQQRVIGQVGWGMDTRVREVRVEHLREPPSPTDLERESSLAVRCAIPSRAPSLGGAVDFVDLFETAPGEIEGRRVDGRTWRRVIGSREILVAGGEARAGEFGPVPTSRPARIWRHSGQRTAAVVDWSGSPGMIETEIIPPDGPDDRPPGARRGEGHGGRAGLILFQDNRNYLIVNDWLDARYGGASVSAFRRVDGFEDVYDAVWANVGSRITWGCPHTLAVGFDATGFAAYLDGVAVLARDFHDVYPRADPLRVRAVGVCLNWEFGDDTGSRFTRLVARRHSPSSVFEPVGASDQPER